MYHKEPKIQKLYLNHKIFSKICRMTNNTQKHYEYYMLH